MCGSTREVVNMANEEKSKSQFADELLALRQRVAFLERLQTQSHHYNDIEQLEQRVLERTTQLEATNRRLENEIAQRKQVEEALQQSLEALRQSEERLRLVVQNMPVMIDAFNDNGEIILWNQECERVTGYSAAEIVGNPLAMELLYPDFDYRQQMMAAWKQHGNNYRDWEWQINCKDGSVKTTSWSNISDRFPIPGWAAWGIGFDITLRKRQQAILAIQNRVLEMIAKGAPIEQVLNVLTRLIEEQSEQAICSILLLDASGTKLYPAAGASIPESYNQGIASGVPVGPNRGSCGTTVYTSKPSLSRILPTIHCGRISGIWH